MTKVTVTSIDGKIVIAGVDAPLEIVTATPPPVDPPVDPPPVDPPPPPPPVVTPSTGIWISLAEISKLPTSGAGWTDVLAAAKNASGATNLANQDSSDSTNVVAAALVMPARGAVYFAKVSKAITDICTKNLESAPRSPWGGN
ncbi:MAG: hypothetical protein IPM07_30910 [Anaerolineales bacterium]|nr:hypothetical protein [Anaerolineales bacterium]